jgi:hypothetical protein
MDEAGISNPEHEPWVVVSGVIVDADKKLIAIERHLDALVTRFIPEQHRDVFVFHATELFNGGGKVFRRDDPAWPLEKRLEIADSLAIVAKKFHIPLAFGFVERKNFPKTIAEELSTADKTLGAHVVSFMTCAMQVEMWMRTNTQGEVCLVVFEDNQQAKRLITKTQTTYQSRSELEKLYDGKIPEVDAQYFPFRRIKQRPLFEPKTPSSVLQLADFCAYVFKKYLMGDRRYDRFFAPIHEQIAVRGFDLPSNRKAS